jgi:alpha-beta hydrolase superfamily lysophospholipase
MGDEQITFIGGGGAVRGVLHWPDQAVAGPAPLVIAVPGWLEVRCSRVSEPFHQGLVARGYPVLAFDFGGTGESEGERGVISPAAQLDDLISAIGYARSRADIDSRRLALFSLGGTGGGIAISAAAEMPDIRAVAVQTVVADAAVWLRSMRREHEWVAFLEAVEGNRASRVNGGPDRLVDPTEEIMVATPERRAAAMPVRGNEYRFSCVEALLRFRPIDVVDRVQAALLICCIENDVVTPEEHALALFRKARSPKRLVRQTGVSHYEAYQKNLEPLLAEFAGWFAKYLTGAPIQVVSAEQQSLPAEHATVVG